MNLQRSRQLQSLRPIRRAGTSAAGAWKHSAALLLLGAAALGPAKASQADAVNVSAAAHAQAAPALRRLEAVQADEPSAQRLALALPSGRSFMTLAESGPERFVQILTLMGVLALASTACAVMATKLTPRRAARAAVPGRGVVVPTGQPLQGTPADRVARLSPAAAPVSERSLTEA